MAFMTYLIRRGAAWHFRYRLPDDLRGKELPLHWPENLKRLVGKDKQRLKHEITESLRTSDNSIARARVGVLISDTELLVREARRFFSDGPARTLSNDVIEYLAERRVRELLSADDEFRKRGAGINLDPLWDSLRIPTGEPAAAHPSEPLLLANKLMTRDDVELLKFGLDRLGGQLRLGVALRQPPEWLRSMVDAALAERGVVLAADAPDRDEIDNAFLASTQRAFKAMELRNAGEYVATPPPATDPDEQHGPSIQDAFELWKTGTLLPGAKVPRQSTVDEASFCIRRFREMHGNPRVGAITREQARTFRDALWRLPKGLPAALERLPITEIIAHPDAAKYSARSSGTLGKHIGLIHAIISKTAKARDLKFKGTGWTNPFDELKPDNNDDERTRDPFSAAELATIFSSAIYTKGHRPKGGQGEAAFWLPVLDAMTGARLSILIAWSANACCHRQSRRGRPCLCLESIAAGEWMARASLSTPGNQLPRP
ncbi:DUF6538 domain-containing protein [Tardiphaga sp. 862_B3_N1_1]|uniref:DUF6538 domain-containing protein n=1 Tax=Tardiphaga sp. 862_B3_N1_1 TaxID=3240763 RepID=UPI003F899077